ncbi:MAG: hypothetical protein RL015_2624 [Verrucomicrobiota bacterium]|jgi:four helix bundle protein
MNLERRNKNRGYQQLLVWQDAIELYRVVFRAFRGWPFKQNKLASQSLASSDSVHRNIAEGYCWRTIREYLQHLNIALGSLGETLSGFIAYSESGQIAASTLRSSTPLSFGLRTACLSSSSLLSENAMLLIGRKLLSSAKMPQTTGPIPTSPTTSASCWME